MKHLTADPDLSRVVSPVRETVAKALQKNSASRFADVRDMMRALGMELDQRYMIIDRGAAAVPPVVQPVAATYAAPHATPPIHGLNCFTGGAAATATSSDEPTRLHYQEPLARAVHNGFLRARAVWNNSSMGPLARAVVVAVIMLFTILNLGWITALVVFAAICYLPYYIVWSILRDTKGSRTASSPAYAATQHHGNHPPVIAQAVVARPGPAVRPAAPKPLSVKQWRVAKRKQLALSKPSMRGAELTGSWLGSLVVIAVSTALATVFQMGSGAVSQPYMVGLVWSAVMAVICSWVAIALGQRWRTSEGDSAVRSFTQLTIGLAVGGIGYALSNYLMVPWSAIAVEEFGDWPVQRWRGFFAEDGTPLLPAFLAYFPLLMGLVHWWKQADPLRRNRFSLFSVLWCVLMAGVAQLILPFPQPWGAVIFAGTSLAVQLSTPWHNPEERLEMTQASMLA